MFSLVRIHRFENFVQEQCAGCNINKQKKRLAQTPKAFGKPCRETDVIANK